MTELTIDQALQQGIEAHQEGNLQDAERLYRIILQSHPEHADANHNLGVLAVSVNQIATALPLLKTALEANPKKEQFWLSHIDALIKAQQFEQAKQAISDGDKAGVVTDKLDILRAQLRSEKESKSPSQAQLDSLLKCYQAGQHGDAEKLALSLTQEFPTHQFGWKVLGAVLLQSGRISESLVASQNSVQLASQDVEAHYNLGNTLKKLVRFDEAEASYRQAIALKPDFVEAIQSDMLLKQIRLLLKYARRRVNQSFK